MEELHHKYLESVVAQCGFLSLQLHPVAHSACNLFIPLHKVYIALKGDTATSLERYYARLLLEDQVVSRFCRRERSSSERLNHAANYGMPADYADYANGSNGIDIEATDARNRGGSGGGDDDDSDDEKRNAEMRSRVVSQTPYMLTTMEQGGYQPDPQRLTLLNMGLGRRAAGMQNTRTVDLGQAFRRQRTLVVLGDPGSGKTTLAKWLSLKFAAAALEEKDHVIVPASQVDPAIDPHVDVPSGNADDPAAQYDEHAEGKTVDLGPTRLPVFLRIADFADALRKQPSLSLFDFLGYANLHPTTGCIRFDGSSVNNPVDDSIRDPPDTNRAALGLFIQSRLNSGEAVILLDGLDEIVARDMRRRVVNAVNTFIEQHILPHSGMPAVDGGNQLLVTSRIVGYHAFPLRSAVAASGASSSIAHVTVQKMTDGAMDNFCDLWMQSVYAMLESDGMQDSFVNVCDATASAASPSVSASDLAKALSMRLKEALHDRTRLGVIDLARNPLLLSIIATTFLQSGTLPSQRSVLYQHAIDQLVSVWGNSARGNDSDLSDSDRLSPDEIQAVLRPVAYYMHEYYSSGLLPESILKRHIAHHMYLYHRQAGSSDSMDIVRRVNTFIAMIRSNFGVMTERGELLFGFVHLTFEEFLAGRHLLCDRQNAADRIIEKLDHPRWREPIILAIGHASANWPVSEFRTFVHRMLFHKSASSMSPATGSAASGSAAAATELSSILAQAPLLVARAISEVEQIDVPVLWSVLEMLLRIYAHPLTRMYQRLRVQVERLIVALQRKFYNDVYTYLGAKMEQNSPDYFGETMNAADSIGNYRRAHDERMTSHLGALACAAADLVCKHQWYTDITCKGLILGVMAGHDRADWNWVMHSALRQMISCTASIQKLFCDASSSPQDANYMSMTRAVLRSWTLLCERDGFLTRCNGDLFADEGASPDAKCQERGFGLQCTLRVRSFLSSDSGESALECIQASPAWLDMVTALYGGLVDTDSSHVSMDYSIAASYLQFSAHEREPFAEFFRYQWEGSDTVLAIAAELDSDDKFQSLRSISKHAPVFKARFLRPDPFPALSDALILAWSAADDASSVVDVCHKIVLCSNSARERAIALMTMCLLGCELTLVGVRTDWPNGMRVRQRSWLEPDAPFESKADPEHKEASDEHKSQRVPDVVMYRKSKVRAELGVLDAQWLMYCMESTLDSLQDGIVRSTKELINAVLGFGTVLPATQLSEQEIAFRWRDVLKEMVFCTIRSGAAVTSLHHMYADAPEGARTHVLAEFWARVIVSFTDDFMYSAAIMIDTFWSENASTDAELIESFVRLPRTAFLSPKVSMLLRSKWNVPRLPLVLDDIVDQVLELYPMFGSSNIAVSLCRASLWGRWKVLLQSSEAQIEVLAWYMKCQGLYIQENYWFFKRRPSVLARAQVSHSSQHSSTEQGDASDSLGDNSDGQYSPDSEHAAMYRQSQSPAAAVVSAVRDRVSNSRKRNDKRRHEKRAKRRWKRMQRERRRARAKALQDENQRWDDLASPMARNRALWYPRFRVLHMAEALTDPYYRARAFVSLIDLFPERAMAVRLATLAREDIGNVHDPVKRATACELLLRKQHIAAPLSGETSVKIAKWGDSVLHIAIDACKDIDNIDNRARMTCRLLFHAPLSQHCAMLLGLVHAMNPRCTATVDEQRCIVECLMTIIPYVRPCVPAMRAVLNLVKLVIRDPWLRAVFNGRLSYQLSSVSAHNVRMAWSLFRTSSRLHSLVDDLRGLMDSVPESIGRDGGSGESDETFRRNRDLGPVWLGLLSKNPKVVARSKRILCEYEDCGGVSLTGLAALVLERLRVLRGRPIAPLLRLITSVELECFPLVNRWLAHSSCTEDQRYCAVLLAERDGLSHRVLPHLVDVLGTSGQWFHRARQVVCPALGIRDHRPYMASRLGHDALWFVARQIEELDNSLVIHALVRFMAHAMIWDDTSILQEAIDVLQRWDQQADLPPQQCTVTRLQCKTAMRMLTSIEALTDDVWLLLRKHLCDPDSSRVLLRTLLRQVMMMGTVYSSLKPKQNESYNNFTDYATIFAQVSADLRYGRVQAHTLNEDEDELLIGGPTEVVTAALFALQDNRTSISRPIAENTERDDAKVSASSGTRVPLPDEEPWTTLLAEAEANLQAHFGGTLATLVCEGRVGPSKCAESSVPSSLSAQHSHLHSHSHSHDDSGRNSSDVDGGVDPELVLSQFLTVSNRNMYQYPPEEIALAKRASSLVQDNFVLFQLLVAWMIKGLREFRERCERKRAAAPHSREFVTPPGPLKSVLRHVMVLVSASAECMPSTFLKICKWSCVAPLLVYMTCSADSCRTKRQSAISILSFLHRIDANVFRALKAVAHEAALAYGDEVPKFLSTVARFQVADMDIDSLFQGLYDYDEYVAYASAQILLAIGCNTSVGTNAQASIVTGLTDALVHPSAKRIIHPSFSAVVIPRLLHLRHALLAVLHSVLSNNAVVSQAELEANAHIEKIIHDHSGTPSEELRRNAQLKAEQEQEARQSQHARTLRELQSRSRPPDAHAASGDNANHSPPVEAEHEQAEGVRSVSSVNERENVRVRLEGLRTAAEAGQVALAQHQALIPGSRGNDNDATELIKIGPESVQSPLTDMMVTLLRNRDMLGVRRLLDLGVSIYGRDDNGMSMIEVAYDNKCFEFVRLMIARASNSFPHCVICWSNSVDTILLPCVHMVVCRHCAVRAREFKNRCPTCRSDIHRLLFTSWPFPTLLEHDADGRAGSLVHRALGDNEGTFIVMVRIKELVRLFPEEG